MNDNLEVIDLDIEESNELLFKVNVEGATAPARVRLVCETPDVSYMFNGNPQDEPGVVQFIIPQMSGKISEAINCAARVEVLIENRYFIPVEFGINFKKTIQVFAEAVKIPTSTKPSGIIVSAAPIVVKRQNPIVESNKSQIKPAKIAKVKQPSRGSLKERMLQRVKSRDDLDNVDDEVLEGLVKKHLGTTRRRKTRR